MYNFFKIKNEKAIKIQRKYRKYKMARNLTILARRARIFKKILARSLIKNLARRLFKLKEEALRKEEMLRLEREKEREKVELEKIKS